VKCAGRVGDDVNVHDHLLTWSVCCGCDRTTHEQNTPRRRSPDSFSEAPWSIDPLNTTTDPAGAST
jgi:hypothetical protein